MSNFLNNLDRRLLVLKDRDSLIDLIQEIEDIRYWIDDVVGTDLEDVLSDFEQEDIKEQIVDFIPEGHRLVELPDINAEADFEELLQEFKSKHILTKIY